MPGYDVKRELKALYAPKNTDWALLTVPDQRFIAVDGHGDPNTSPDYAEAVQALYAVAYALKFAEKAAGRDFTVPPLEGLWNADDPEVFRSRAKHLWDWTMLIALPDGVEDAAVEAARETARAKKGLASIGSVRVERLSEGRCAQVLHIGSYDDETPTMERLHREFLPAEGLVPTGRHHEVYLSDPRRTEPAKRKTVIRQPVRAAD